MKLKLALAALGAAISLMTGVVRAEDLPMSADAAYKDLEAVFGGQVPTHMKAYPPTAIAGAWAMSKGLLFDEGNELDLKTKSLIGLAVAAQIPCQYCIWYETKAAKGAGATDAQVSEAVAQAAYVRHWSTVLNGLQIPFETFQAEFGGEQRKRRPAGVGRNPLTPRMAPRRS